VNNCCFEGETCCDEGQNCPNGTTCENGCCVDENLLQARTARSSGRKKGGDTSTRMTLHRRNSAGRGGSSRGTKKR
jgi:hypothetical protein